MDGPGDAARIEELVRSVGVESSSRLGGLAAKSGRAERELIRSMPKVISMLEGLGEMDRFRVRQVVVTLTQGMEMDLTYFHKVGVTGFETAEELDEYTYLVAGCVGQFWTEMSMDHNPGLGGWDAREMSEKGVRFGKALQLTNILRDVPKDLRLGRCYLPREVLGGVWALGGGLARCQGKCQGEARAGVGHQQGAGTLPSRRQVPSCHSENALSAPVGCRVAVADGTGDVGGASEK